MKIAVYTPQSVFTASQIKQLQTLGNVTFVPDSNEMPLDELTKFGQNSEIIAVDPDAFGGFSKGKAVLTQLMDTLPNLKHVCLSTTSFGWIDLEYCGKRKITVSNVPGYSRESVAEHALAMILCLAKRIIITDRRTQKGEYRMEKGFELKGKTLGIIGLGSIGSRVAELGHAIGMNVIAYNRTPASQPNVTMKTLEEVISRSDVISLNTTHEPANVKFISRELLAKTKKGMIMVNTVDDEIVDEEALAELLKSGHIYGYAVETGNFDTPLAKIENAILLHGFGWYTHEALENLYQILVENISAAVQNKPVNLVP